MCVHHRRPTFEWPAAECRGIQESASRFSNRTEQTSSLENCFRFSLHLSFSLFCNNLQFSARVRGEKRVARAAGLDLTDSRLLCVRHFRKFPAQTKFSLRSLIFMEQNYKWRSKIRVKILWQMLSPAAKKSFRKKNEGAAVDINLLTATSFLRPGFISCLKEE